MQTLKVFFFNFQKHCLRRARQSESITRTITDYSKNKIATLDHFGLPRRLNFTATSWVIIPVVCFLVSPPQAFCAAVDSGEKPSTPRGLHLHDSAPGAQQPLLTLSCSDTVKALFPWSGSFSVASETEVWCWTFHILQQNIREGLHPEARE